MIDPPPTINFSTLLASSVHDMKNSVTLLLLSVQELLEKSEAKTPEEQHHLSKLEYEARRINNDLVQLLTLYRLDEKTLSVHDDEAFIVDLLTEQIARNESLFTYRQIELSLECDPNLVWYLDSELIGSVINNLLLNAARYAKSRVKLSAVLNGQYLNIVVEDDGGGFPDFMLISNQDAQSQVISSSTRLGLIFARQILSLHKRAGRSGQLLLNNQGIADGARIELQIP